LSKSINSAALGEYVTEVATATCGAAGMAGFELEGVWRDGVREFMYLGVSNDVSEAVAALAEHAIGVVVRRDAGQPYYYEPTSPSP
jgi:hypothetical protein